jgi:hypothetical protein
VIYLKSLGVGLLAVLLVGLLVIGVGILVLIVVSIFSKNQDSVIGFDFVALGRSRLVLSIGLLAFVAGFLWEYMRISPR